MKNRTLLLLSFILLGAVTAAGAQADASETAPADLQKLLQDALFAEEATQDLTKAAAAYEALLEAYTEQRRLAATALFRLAEVRRKQDRPQDAIAHYQQLLRDFPAEEPLARLSRENLLALGVDEGELANPAPPVLDDEESREIARLRELMAKSPDLLRSPVQVEGKGEFPTALHRAAAAGQLCVIEFLLDNGFPVDGGDADEPTPLRLAAEAGQKTACEVLLQRGADIDASHPLFGALERGHLILAHRVQGLGAGADDYLVKSLSMKELMTRVRALLRRSESDRRSPQELVLGAFTVDFSRQTCERNGRRIELSDKEFGGIFLRCAAPAIAWRWMVRLTSREVFRSRGPRSGGRELGIDLRLCGPFSLEVISRRSRGLRSQVENPRQGELRHLRPETSDSQYKADSARSRIDQEHRFPHTPRSTPQPFRQPMSLPQGFPAFAIPGWLVRIGPAAFLACFALVGCSNTSKDVEVDPTGTEDEWTRLRNHFAGWTPGEDGLPDRTLRSEFERNREYERTEWKAESYSRDEYPDHPFFRTETVERPAWKGHGSASESGATDKTWQGEKSKIAEKNFKTGAARESNKESPRSSASLPDREFASGPSIEDSKEVPLKILKEAGSDKTLSRKEAAKRILDMPDRDSAMTVEEVRRLLSPD